MSLCQVSLQSFSEAKKNKASKKRKVESVGLVPPRQADAELLAAISRQGREAEVGAQALERAPRLSRTVANLTVFKRFP